MVVVVGTVVGVVALVVVVLIVVFAVSLFVVCEQVPNRPLSLCLGDPSQRLRSLAAVCYRFLQL